MGVFVSLSDLFGCTFVINLTERKDRLKAISRELAQAGMPFSTGRVERFNAIRPVEACGFPTPGVRGCFLSHLGVLREAQRRKLASLLILEDDLTFSPLIAQHMTSLERSIGLSEWGFIYMGHTEPVLKHPPIELIRYSGPIVTAHFYAVNGAVLEPLIEYLEKVQLRPPGHPEGGPMHLDGALTMFRQANPKIPTLIAQPNLGWQRASRSDLHSNWFQSAPVFAEMYDVGRYVRRIIMGDRHRH